MDELISAEELEKLPEDDDRAFVTAESICRRNVLTAIRQDQTERGEYAEEMRLQYIATISALAEQFGVHGLAYPDVQNAYQAYADFSRAAQAEAAKIIARNRRSRHAFSVELSSKTRARIEQQIANLRRAIDESELPGRRKTALHGKLDELVAELRNNRRISFGKAMAVLAVVAASAGNLGGAVAGVAEAPLALNNIIHLIGIDKEAEEAEIARLGVPARALPAPRPATSATPTRGGAPITPTLRRDGGASWDAPSGTDLDDEIPF
jgi:hypothetical protein